MINYIRADLQRIFAKKSLYITFGILAIGYIVMLVTNGVTSGGKIFNEAGTIFMLVALCGGGYLFATLYTDDLTAKTLPALIGFGMKRRTILIAKLCMNILLTFLLCGGTFLLLYATLSLVGFEMTSEALGSLLRMSVVRFLQLVAFGSIASVLVYGTQKATFSIVTFILLVTALLSWLVKKFLGMAVISGLFGDLSQYLIDPLIEGLVAAPKVATALPYVLYLAVFVLLSIVAFRKKELEF